MVVTGACVVEVVVKLTVMDPPPTAAVVEVIIGVAGDPSGRRVDDGVE